MPQTAHRIASGRGWRAADIVCTAGPGEPVEEEKHEGFCVAAVLGGTFQYRGSLGDGLMAPGSILLGNEGQCFACGHAHGVGDRCLSFQFTPEFVEAIAAAIPGVRTVSFTAPKLPPSPELAPLFAEAAAARDAADEEAVEELAFRFTGYALSKVTETRAMRSRIEEEHAVARAVRVIEVEAFDLESDALSLSSLAARAKMAPYRFLRLFRRVAGMTPHQYVLHLRLARAAEWLIAREDDISAIALEAGFNDLSTFNHRFRRVFGETPGAWRNR